MNAGTFDTYAAARELEAAGLDRHQAEAIAKTVRDGQGDLATKADVAVLAHTTNASITALETRLVKWAIGLAFAVAAVVLAGVRLMLDTGA